MVRAKGLSERYAMLLPAGYTQIVITVTLTTVLSAWCGVSSAQDLPDVPAGLESTNQQTAQPAAETDDAPDIPSALGGGDNQGLPDVPQGLGSDSTTLPATDTASEPTDIDKALELPFSLHGFWEVRGGVRLQHPSDQRQASIGETRLKLEFQKRIENLTIRIVPDLLYDGVAEHHSVDLESGAGMVDLREAHLTFTPFDFMDVRVGRQILTWGTGDLIFINDNFPKDWQSFFAGRDSEYLKAPSDAAKISMFSDLVNWDIVFTPRFDSDRFITGQRNSYYSPMAGGTVGQSMQTTADKPNEWISDHEWATRFSKNVNGYELAAYGYWGFWKSPGGMDLLSQKATFPRLAVYGASIRGQFLEGIGNLEFGYLDSMEDRDGNDPFINNSQWRFLAGYEQDLSEIASDFTIGMQYYVELMTQYDRYRDTFPAIAGFKPADRDRHVITVRLTKLLFNQNLTCSLFAYYSPTDSDAYLRPKVSYKIDDRWTAEIGGNVFFGIDDHTFFGQFEDNTNIYVALRYSF